MKQGTYRSLGNRAYGELKGATVESQKALARGLKEELANQYPELKDLNATDSRLINLHKALEKAVVRGSNKEPLGIGGPIVYGAVHAAGGGEPLSIAAGVLKHALSNPAVKSRLAIALNGTPRGIGASTLAASGSGQIASDRSPQP